MEFMELPETSKKVMELIHSMLIKQNEKGVKKYGETIDEVNLSKYDWNVMVIEKLIDSIQYLVKDNKTLHSLGYGKSIDDYCMESFKTAIEKGWHDKERSNAEVLVNIHGEVSEAMEEDKLGNTEKYLEELADVCIRIFDECGAKDFDLQSAIDKKMEKNKERTYRHGNKKY